MDLESYEARIKAFEEEGKRVAMQRINRAGRWTLICMGLIACAACAYWLFR